MEKNDIYFKFGDYVLQIFFFSDIKIAQINLYDEDDLIYQEEISVNKKGESQRMLFVQDNYTGIVMNENNAEEYSQIQYLSENELEALAQKSYNNFIEKMIQLYAGFELSKGITKIFAKQDYDIKHIKPAIDDMTGLLEYGVWNGKRKEKYNDFYVTLKDIINKKDTDAIRKLQEIITRNTNRLSKRIISQYMPPQILSDPDSTLPQ